MTVDEIEYMFCTEGGVFWLNDTSSHRLPFSHPTADADCVLNLGLRDIDPFAVQ